MKSVILIALHRLHSVFLSLLPALLVSMFSVGAEGEPPESPAVAAAMQTYLDSYKLAGYIAIIADKTGEVHFQNIAGYADVEGKVPMREGNLFWIASMTKMFAGASIMMLVDEGKLSLDDAVTRFIPQLERWMVVEEKDQSHVLLKPLVRPVTIRHLLSHTSGLTGTSELQQVTGADSTPLKARALSSVTGPLQWQPGDKYAYGNQGMNIAARIVEIVSAMPYEEFLQKRFFDPLGMAETTFWPSDSQAARLAGAYGPNQEKSGYVRGSISFLTRPYSDRGHRFPEAGGGLFSTTHDILRYGLMLANDGELEGKRYLSHQAMDELRREQTGATKVNYSLGYHLRNGLFGHDGAYGTDLSVDPATGMVAIFMIQCTSGDQWAARDLFLKTATQVFQKQSAASGASEAERTTAGTLLPAGFLSTRGNQIIGADGRPVRIASVGLTGMNVIGGRLQLAGPFKGVDGHVTAMRAMGFNCVRVDWINKTLDDARALEQLDAFVAACARTGLKVIFDNHNNEATPADWENAAQQKNGLWFDTGPGTDGTDGAGTQGTVSASKFQDDWVTFAKRWVGNSTVIGFDLHNEPCAHTKTPALWGSNGPTDIHAMYEAVGNAILSINPDALIICEAVINYQTGAFEGDLSVVRNLPVVLSNRAKLVYSVHEYPREIGEYRGPESGPGYVERMNKMWGWLITENVAPVWIGEAGASMTLTASQAWGRTLLDYMNGKAPGGPTFSGEQQPISGDWWAWGCLTGQNPNGCVGEDGKVRPEQAPFIRQMLFDPKL